MPPLTILRSAIHRASLPSAVASGDFPWDHNRTLSGTILYVDRNDGTTTGDGSTGSPYSFEYAISLASAGETIAIRTNSTLTVSEVEMNTVNSGTAGNVIEITSAPGFEPTINCGGSYGFRLSNANYWRFSHLYFTNCSSPIWGGYDASCNGLEVYSIDTNTTVGGDNSGTVFLNGSGPCLDFDIDLIRHTLVGDNTLVPQNSAAICILDESEPNVTAQWTGTVNRVEAYNLPKGFYIKVASRPGASSNGEIVTVSNSFTTGSNQFGFGENQQEYRVENCVFNDDVQFSESTSPSGGDWNTFDHCTFLGQTALTERDYSGATPPAGSEHSRNNVFRNCILTDLRLSTLSTIISNSDYNLFVNDITRNSETTPTTQDLAAWQTANSTDSNSIQGTPTYVGADKSVIANCGLASGTGVNAASDGTDMGANVALVGVNG